jgi:hypothetical protein
MTMHATHWLLGCGLCIASFGVMAAPHVDTQDLDSSARTSVDSGSARDAGGTTGNDVLGLGHDSNAHGGGIDAEAPASTSRSGSGSAPARARSSHVGWQSLLPGSIQ